MALRRGGSLLPDGQIDHRGGSAMASKRLFGLSLGLLAALAVAWTASPAAACPFCGVRGPTLLGDYAQATMVLYGKFTNPKLKDDGGTTDFAIDKCLKGQRVLGDKKVITLPRYVPNTKSKYLIFCDVYKGKVDPYRGEELQEGGDIVKYLKGAMSLQGKTVSQRLRYCFAYLDNPEQAISMDAYREFAAADYKDYRHVARKFPPDRIAGWLKDSKTPAYRYGLYASLLGHCGKAKHAKLLRELLDSPERRTGSGVDGMLVAYTLLDPKEGWAYIRDRVLSRPKEEFQFRYAGLRAVRFFWDYRPDVIKRKDLIGAVCLLLKQPDVADFAIEDLRKWKAWEAADQVLGLANKKSHDVPVIRRALLRFALSCPPSQKKAAQFVKAERQKDKEYVADVEELLKLEAEAPPPSAGGNSTSNKSSSPSKTIR
jgi:hypothetical protein